MFDGQARLTLPLHDGGAGFCVELVREFLSVHPDVSLLMCVAMPWAWSFPVVPALGLPPTLGDIDAHWRSRSPGVKLPRMWRATDQLARGVRDFFWWRGATLR